MYKEKGSPFGVTAHFSVPKSLSCLVNNGASPALAEIGELEAITLVATWTLAKKEPMYEALYSPAHSLYVQPSDSSFAGVAQLVEHLPCKEDVAGSSPVTSLTPHHRSRPGFVLDRDCANARWCRFESFAPV